MASIQHQKGRGNPYRVFWRDEKTGKKRNKCFARRKEAQTFVETIRAPENVTAQSHPSMTIRDALDAWYKQAITIGLNGREPVEASTAEMYRKHSELISMRIGAIKLCDLNELKCEKIRDSLLVEYSRTYSKKLFTSFKSSLKFAAKQGYLPTNPATDVNVHISKRHRNASRTKIPNLADVYGLTQAIDRLMSSPNGNIKKAWQRFGPLFYTQLYTGLRPSEIRGLTWKNVNWKRGGLSVTQRADEEGHIGSLKSGAAERFIPTPAIVFDHLKIWQKICPKNRNDLVFPTWKGTVESRGNITNRGWYPLCREAGLTKSNGTSAKFSLYSLRHIKASLEIELGRSPKHIQQIMGHEDVRMTFDVYGHLFDDHDAVDNPNAAYDLVQTVARKLPEKT